MFPARYFSPRYWAARFWPKVGSDIPVLTPDVVIAQTWAVTAPATQRWAETAVAAQRWRVGGSS